MTWNFLENPDSIRCIHVENETGMLPEVSKNVQDTYVGSPLVERS